METLFLVVVLLLVLGVFYSIVYFVFLFLIDNAKRSSYESLIPGYVILEVKLPKNNEYEISSAEQMFVGLQSIYRKQNFFEKMLSLQDSVSFEIVSWKGKIKFFVSCHSKYFELVSNLIRGAYPTAEITQVKNYNIFPPQGEVEFAELALAKKSYFPIRKYDKFGGNDPLNLIISAMSMLDENSSLVFQVLVSPTSDKWQKSGKMYIHGVESAQKNPENKSPTESPEVIASISEKISKVGFNATIRIISTSSDKHIAKRNLQNLEASLNQFEDPRGNKFRRIKLSWLKNFLYKNNVVYDFVNKIPSIWVNDSILSISELATVFHFPSKKIESSIISWLLSKKAPPDERVHYKGLWLGVSNYYKDQVRDIAMGNIDDRRRHMYIIGQTGTGKSFFLQNLILQDINNGNGVCFIDPHGDSVEWVLERIPPHRIEDVIYWNPGDFERPFGFNILENRSEEEKHFIVNSFYKMIQKLFDPNNQGITGPILERAIRSVLLTAMAKKGGTLIEAMKCLLLDWDVINDLKQYVTDPFVRDYWEKEIPSTPESRRGELLGYFTSKLDRFISNRLMRNMLGQTTSSFDLRRVMDEGKILLVNLSKGLIGQENSEFLGLLLVPKILSSAMSRVDIPMEERRDFFLYVDEFQNFATDDFAVILSEARKFRLNLIVANQYIGQMQEQVRNAVFGNVGSIIAFNVGADDSKFLENIFAPTFDAYDLTNLENQNAYVKLMVDGTRPAPFSMRTTLKYIPPSNKKVRDLVVEISRNLYGRDVKVVEADILRRMRSKASWSGV